MTNVLAESSPKSSLLNWDDPSRTAEQIIRQLAEDHSITATVTAGDKLADDMARLAGDDVVLDEVEQLVVNIGKLDIYDGIDLTRLQARYLKELKAS